MFDVHDANPLNLPTPLSHAKCVRMNLSDIADTVSLLRLAVVQLGQNTRYGEKVHKGRHVKRVSISELTLESKILFPDTLYRGIGRINCANEFHVVTSE